MRLLFYIAFCLLGNTVLSQVGIGTADPQNDLHINGGLRIDDSPLGSDDDARSRLLARDANGDLVTVQSSQIVESVAVPQLAYQAKFGVTTSSIFETCSPCNSNDSRRIEFVDPVVNINNTSLVTLIDPSATDGDEYFQIEADGFYRFEINTNITLSGSTDFLINLQLDNDKATLPDETDSFRVFGGVPRGNVTAALSLPIYATDVRFYNAGDRITLSLSMAYVSTSGGREVSSLKPIGTSYIGQVIITKY